MKFVRFISAFLVLLMVTSVIPFSFLTVRADAAEDIPEIHAGETLEVTIENAGDVAYLKFVPEEDGWYSFTSHSENDTYGYLLDEEMSEIYSDDDGGEENNFLIERQLTKDTNYYFKCRFYDSGRTGSYEVELKKMVTATGMTFEEGTSYSGTEGEYFILHPVFQPENAKTEYVSLSSNNEAVADVSYGNVRLIGAGDAVITATSASGLTADFTVHVAERETIALDETKTVEISEPGEKVIFKFTPDEDGYYIFFSSTNNVNQCTYVNVFDSQINYIASNEGGGETYNNFKVRVKLTAGETYYFESHLLYDVTGSFPVTLKKAVAAQALTLEESAIGYVEDYFYIDYEFTPEDSAPETITWTSGNEDIVTVDYYGELYFVGEGTTTVTATSSSGLTDTCTVTSRIPETLTLDTPQLTQIEKNRTVKYYFTPSESGEYIFYCSDKSLFDNCSVRLNVYNPSGYDYYYGYEKFNCTLTAGTKYTLDTYFDWYTVDSGGNGSYNVTVTKAVPATELTLSDSSANVYVNTSWYLYAEVEPDNAMIGNFSWTSSDEKIATVSSYGRNCDVYFHNTGTVTITADTGTGLTASCTFNVKEYEAIALEEVKTVRISPENRYEYYKFIPDEDGYYAFYSMADMDTYGYIYDRYFSEIDYDDDSGEGTNFRAKCYMTAGETYYLATRLYNTENTGVFDVSIEKSKGITALSLESMPDKTEYIRGYVSQGFNLSGLSISAEWTDGSTSLWRYNDHNDYMEDERVYFDTNNIDETGVFTVSCGGQSLTCQLTLIDSPVESIELVSGTSKVYYEGFNGYIDKMYIEETDTYEEYFRYNTYYPSDAVIRIKYKDGTSETANVGSYVGEYQVTWTDNQWNAPWHVGADNVSIISYLGATCTLPITVLENPVESIEVVSWTPVTYIENANGYWDRIYISETDTYEDYYYYYTNNRDFSSAVLNIHFKDGRTVETHPNNYVDDYYVGISEDQHYNHWYVGGDNYVFVTYMGVKAKLPVALTANPLDHIVINTPPTREYVYGDTAYGQIDYNGDYYFYPNDLTGLTFTAFFTNGTSKQYTPGSSSSGMLDGYGYWINYNSYSPTPGDFPVTFCYMGKTAEYTVKLNDSAVSSIEVTKLPDKTEYSSNFIPIWDGLELTIHNSDGTSDTVTITSENSGYKYFSEYSSYRFAFTYNGYDGYIVQANNTTYNVQYRGRSCSIDGLTFVNDKQIKSVELTGFTFDGTGTMIKITYTDNTQETITLSNILLTTKDQSNFYVTIYAQTEKGVIRIYAEEYDDHYYVYIFGRDINVNKVNFILGDVNLDKKVTIKDVLKLRKYLASIETVEPLGLKAADVNHDNKVTIKDVLKLRKYLANIEPLT